MRAKFTAIAGSNGAIVGMGVAMGIALGVGTGCNAQQQRPAARTSVSDEGKAEATESQTAPASHAKPRPLPACLKGMEGLSEADANQREAELEHELEQSAAGDTDGSDPAAVAPPNAARLQLACTSEVRRFEIQLAVAIQAHRDLLSRNVQKPEAWDEIERRWGATATRFGTVRQTCERTVPGLAGIGDLTRAEAFAAIGAGRQPTAEALYRKLSMFYPTAAPALEPCLEAQAVARIKKEVEASNLGPELLTKSPATTGAAACDALAAGNACILRQRLPDTASELEEFVNQKRQKPGRAEVAKCEQALERQRQAFAGKSWCFAEDYPAVRQQTVAAVSN